MELVLNPSKILLLDSDFKPEMLENNQAVVSHIDGQAVLMVSVNLNELKNQSRNARVFVGPENLRPRQELFERDVKILFDENNRIRNELESLKLKYGVR